MPESVEAGVRDRYPPYPEYRDSAVEWLGEIPAHWEVKRLKLVAALNSEVLGEQTDPDFEMSYIDISVDGLVSPNYIVARPRPGVSSNYYEELFRTPGYREEINRYSHGIVPDRNRLYWDQFKAMRSQFPPPAEQQEIVSYIERESGLMQGLTDKVEFAVERLREYRSALISAAVTGKIDVRKPRGQENEG